jgi:hypothetical protein
VLATVVDYVTIVPWLALLGAVGTCLRWAGLVRGVPDAWTGRLLAQLAVMLVLTVPVTLWFAWWEAGRHTTPGKRLLGLRVDGQHVDGGRLSFRRAVLRSAIKVALPWELAHAAVWQMWDREVSVLAMVLLGSVYIVSARRSRSCSAADVRSTTGSPTPRSGRTEPAPTIARPVPCS